MFTQLSSISQGHGRLALNWQEAEELRLRQLAETRKQRLLQVREQANQQSQQKLRSYQQQRQALSKVKLAELKNDWEISKERALVGLRQIRDSSLQQVGTSHICAAQALSQNSGRRQQKMAETAGHNRAAMERHSAAMAAEAAERMAAAEARKEMLARQDKVRKMELQRSFAAVAESSRRVRELAAKQEETQQREKELMAQGLPSGIDFKYTRLHELGMPEVVERHYGAGCDGHGKGMLAAVAYETERSAPLLAWCPASATCLQPLRLRT